MRVFTRRRFISLTLATCAAGVIATRAREHDAPGGIAYGQAHRQRLDVYVPESGADSGRPVVVYFSAEPGKAAIARIHAGSRERSPREAS